MIRLLAGIVLTVVLPLAAYANGVVQSLKGDVRAGLPGQPGTAVAVDQRLNPGSAVVTGAGAQVILRFDDGQQVVLNQNTEFRIVDFYYEASDSKMDRTVFELIKGALYLSLGQHTEAGRIFQALLNDNVSLDVRNRAWFYLAKLWYQRGYLAESERALQSIQGSLPQSIDTERHMLFAQVLLNQGRFDEAINALQAIDSKNSKQVSDSWLAYARFNLGVALVRQNRIDEAGGGVDE